MEDSNTTCSLLGIPVASLGADETLEKIIAAAKSRPSPPAYVATVNLDFLVNSFYSKYGEELLSTLYQADLVTADGMPIVWFLRCLGTQLPARVSGADLLLPLAKRAAEEGLSLYFLGGDRGALQCGIQRLTQHAPTLIIAGSNHERINLSVEQRPTEEDKRIVDAINESGTDLLILSLGNPKQELWFQRNKASLRVGLAIGLGGSINFLAGRQARAAPWMQKAGLEWLHRLYQEPRRLWRRYATGGIRIPQLFGPPLIAQLLASASKRQERPAYINLSEPHASTPFLTIATPEALASGNVPATSAETIIDLRDVSWLNGALASSVVHWLSQRATHRDCILYSRRSTRWSIVAHRLHHRIALLPEAQLKERMRHLPVCKVEAAGDELLHLAPLLSRSTRL